MAMLLFHGNIIMAMLRHREFIMRLCLSSTLFFTKYNNYFFSKWISIR